MTAQKNTLPAPTMSTRKKSAPAPNISQLARDHKVSRETVRKLRENGIDLADGKAVTQALACSRAAKLPLAPTPADGESYSEARRRRAIADADRAEVIAKRESGSVIAVSDVEAVMSEIGATMRSRLLSMRSDLVVELEGRSGAQIYAALDKRITELLTAIHNNSPIKKS
jgi:hypothetical protein